MLKYIGWHIQAKKLLLIHVAGEKFTQTEAKVLMGLMSHQHEPDRTIAEMLGMAPSNFAVVKRRLAERGVLVERPFLDMARVPDAKIAAFAWIEYNQPVGRRAGGRVGGAGSGFPTAQAYAGRDWTLDIGYFHTFEEAEGARLRLSEAIQGKAKKYVSNHLWKLVPLSHLSIYTFPGRLTRYVFTHKNESMHGLSNADVVEQVGAGGIQPRLNETEKRVLIALRKFPGTKRGKIAEMLGIRQGTLSEVAGRLGAKGIIAANRMPDLCRLPGREMAAFAWAEFSQPLSKEEYGEVVLEIINSTPQLYKIYMSRTFLLMISVFHSLDKAEGSNLAMLERFGGNLKSLSLKVVPTRHMQALHSHLFLEQLFRPAQ